MPMLTPTQLFIPHEKHQDEIHQDEIQDEVIPREAWEDNLLKIANSPGSTVRVPRDTEGQLTRKRVVNAFLDAFHLIGGTPRLALWADENPTEFYRIYAKLLPKQTEAEVTTSGDMTIRHVLPRGPLDE